MALKVKIRADQVVSNEDGVVKWITDGGEMCENPEGELIIGEAGAPATAEADKPVEEAPKPAKAKKVAIPKAEKPVKATKPAKAAATPTPKDATPAAQVTQKPEAEKPQKPVKEKIVAKAKAKAKTAKGVRTIGGKEVDLSAYKKVKAPGGGTSFNNGDATAKKLEGKNLDDVYKIVAKDTKQNEAELRKRYAKLNPGMQRMALGNMHRKGPRTEKEKKAA